MKRFCVNAARSLRIYTKHFCVNAASNCTSDLSGTIRNCIVLGGSFVCQNFCRLVSVLIYCIPGTLGLFLIRLTCGFFFVNTPFFPCRVVRIDGVLKLHLRVVTKHAVVLVLYMENLVPLMKRRRIFIMVWHITKKLLLKKKLL